MPLNPQKKTNLPKRTNRLTQKNLLILLPRGKNPPNKASFPPPLPLVSYVRGYDMGKSDFTCL